MEGTGLLALWDAGAKRYPLMRGALLLAAAMPESDARDPLDVGIGERDHLLLKLRERWFGTSMPCLCSCPKCEALSEFELDTRSLRTDYAFPAVVSSRDLAAAGSFGAFEERFRGVDWDVDDSQSEIRLELGCAECGHAWVEPFDVVDYLWVEVSDQAQRLMDDVHTLAMAYGWTEDQILQLPSSRRKRYLERVVA